MTHVPVLTAEILTHLQPTPQDTLLDATLGLGGHAAAYLEATAPTGRVVGLEADERALAAARRRLARYGNRVIFVHANFASLKDSVTGGGILPPRKRQPPAVLFTHILFDLGVGSHQLADPGRGFSFRRTAPLTMQYGIPPAVSAQLEALNWLERRLGYLPDARDIIAGLPAGELAVLIRHYGEERYAGRIARALKRSPQPETASQVAERIAHAVPAGYEHGRLHPATRTFQALRLAANRELEALAAALPEAVALLAPGGIIAVISFHSLEDRIVKHFFKEHEHLTVITKKPITATASEKAVNPRSRSAKLRFARQPPAVGPP